MADALPVTRARRLALDAVMAWARERERLRGAPCGPVFEHVGYDGKTTITGCGNVHASEAVDKLEAFADKLLAPEAAREPTFTLSQVKAAYWATFHKAGELWFNYLGSDEENEDSTRGEWDAFVEHLERSRG